MKLICQVEPMQVVLWRRTMPGAISSHEALY